MLERKAAAISKLMSSIVRYGLASQNLDQDQDGEAFQQADFEMRVSLYNLKRNKITQAELLQLDARIYNAIVAARNYVERSHKYPISTQDAARSGYQSFVRAEARLQACANELYRHTPVLQAQ